MKIKLIVFLISITIINLLLVLNKRITKNNNNNKIESAIKTFKKANDILYDSVYSKNDTIYFFNKKYLVGKSFTSEINVY